MTTSQLSDIAGSRDRLNQISGLSSVIAASQAEIDSSNLSNTTYPITKSAHLLCYNTTTNQLMVSNDVSRNVMALRDHSHPLYALTKHTHMAGANVPWLMSNPQLWYIGDLPNHPELIPLDGKILPEGSYGQLDEMYDGETVFTTFPDKYDGKYYNEDLRLSASNFVPQGYLCNLFGPPLTIDDISKAHDQWLTSSSDVSAEQYFVVELTNGKAYRPGCYVMYPAAGTPLNPLLVRPTPKHWVVEGVAEDSEEDVWELLDEHADVTDWYVFSAKTYRIEDVQKCYRKFRVTIKEWNPGEEVPGAPLCTGLRRFWFTGRHGGMFSLPNIPSPHPDFVWVVPRDTVSVGLKHEDVGDVGITAVRPELLPPYRLVTDGRLLDRSAYPLLRDCIVGSYDEQITGTVSCAGQADSSLEVINIADVSTGEVVVEFTAITPFVASSYEFALSQLDAAPLASSGSAIPVSWMFEGLNTEGAWDIVHTVSESAYTDGSYDCRLDAVDVEVAYTKYRIRFTKFDTASGNSLVMTKPAVYGHPLDKFYLPMSGDNASLTTYIVADIPTVDVSGEIISKLQRNVAQLQAAHQQLQNQINDLHKPTVQRAVTTFNKR